MPAVSALGAVADWPVGHAAVAVATFTGPSGSAPTGRASLVASTGPDERPFPWASVTKPATALAVLVATEEGTLDLDEPAGPPGSTVRHLLAHASGLGPEPGPPLGRPGRTRIYSNAGYRLLGDLVARRAGIPFADYLVEGVLGPLGMRDTLLDPDEAAGPPAAGLRGPLTDLVRLATEWAVPTLIGEATHRAAVSVQFPTLAGVLPGFGRFEPCQWGLGVELRGAKDPHWTGRDNGPDTYGHFGRSGAFFWVDPAAGALCAGLTDRTFGPWAARAWPALADSILGDLASPARHAAGRRAPPLG